MVVHHDRLRPCPVRPDRLLSEDGSLAGSGSAPVQPPTAPAGLSGETRPASSIDLTVEEPRDLAVSDQSRTSPAAGDVPAEEPAGPEASPPQLDRYPRRQIRPPDRLTYEKT